MCEWLSDFSVDGFIFSFEDLSKAMSQDGASQFQEVIRQELELSVKKELEKILITAPSHEFEVRTLQCFVSFYPSAC